jgi:hypothetical protein
VQGVQDEIQIKVAPTAGVWSVRASFSDGAPGSAQGSFAASFTHITDGTNSAVVLDGSADGRATTNIGVVATDMPLVFNGTTWDRLRGDNTGAARTSLYGTRVAAGDTALKADQDGELFVAPFGGATAVTGSATAAAAAMTATLAGAVGKTTYISGFLVTGAGATAATNISVTITGTISGTLNYTITVPAGVTTGIQPLGQTFAIPIPASATNTAIVVNVPSFGAGNTNAAVAAYGFQL